jgi:hypothetical protein
MTDMMGMFLALETFGLRDIDIFVEQGLKEGIVDVHGVDLIAHEDSVSEEEAEVLKAKDGCIGISVVNPFMLGEATCDPAGLVGTVMLELEDPASADGLVSRGK